MILMIRLLKFFYSIRMTYVVCANIVEHSVATRIAELE